MMKKFKFLTQEQKLFFLKREIRAGASFPFPPMGFTAYESPKYDAESATIHTNPFTKSLAGERFKVKEITENGFCKGNFERRPKGPDIFIRKTELEMRGLMEAGLLFLICSIPFILYNAWKHYIPKWFPPKPKKQPEPTRKEKTLNEIEKRVKRIKTKVQIINYILDEFAKTPETEKQTIVLLEKLFIYPDIIVLDEHFMDELGKELANKGFYMRYAWHMSFYYRHKVIISHNPILNYNIDYDYKTGAAKEIENPPYRCTWLKDLADAERHHKEHTAFMEKHFKEMKS